MSDAVDVAGVVAGLGVFGAAWWRARSGDVERAEAELMHTVNRAPHSLYGPVAGVMQLGSLGGGLAASVALARRHRRQGAAAAVAVFGVWLGAKIVKRTTGRGRPGAHLDGIVVRGRPQTGLGFPSGHAAVATVVAVVAGPIVGPGVRAALVGAAVTTVAARMYVGAHLPLDVVGGAGLGLAAGCAARALTRC